MSTDRRRSISRVVVLLALLVGNALLFHLIYVFGFDNPVLDETEAGPFARIALDPHPVLVAVSVVAGAAILFVFFAKDRWTMAAVTLGLVVFPFVFLYCGDVPISGLFYRFLCQTYKPIVLHDTGTASREAVQQYAYDPNCDERCMLLLGSNAFDVVWVSGGDPASQERVRTGLPRFKHTSLATIERQSRRAQGPDREVPYRVFATPNSSDCKSLDRFTSIPAARRALFVCPDEAAEGSQSAAYTFRFYRVSGLAFFGWLPTSVDARVYEIGEIASGKVLARSARFYWRRGPQFISDEQIHVCGEEGDFGADWLSTMLGR